jgi:hypothetical protein
MNSFQLSSDVIFSGVFTLICWCLIPVLLIRGKTGVAGLPPQIIRGLGTNPDRSYKLLSWAAATLLFLIGMFSLLSLVH